MRVMSYNIKGQAALTRGAHVERIAAVIREAHPDVAGLQEVHRNTWQSRFTDQAAELERLTGMALAFGRSLGGRERQYGNAILTRGRVVDSRVEPLPGRGEPRTLLDATIELDGLRLRAYVTHLAAWGRLGARTRLMQAEAVARLISKSDLPFILTGDFNSNPGSDEMRALQGGGLVTSCFTDAVTHRATRQCLDSIFVDRGWQIRNAQVLTRGPSDHWPLVADIERPSPGTRVPSPRSGG
jgi:endonuclease/exonuclease/phosphatase family metal-dependent hydrolase